MLERGFVFGTTRLFRRAWQIYVAHVLLFVFYLVSVLFLSARFNASDFIHRFNVAPLLVAPVETLTQGLMLRYKPLNLDVLPLYVVLMGVFPPVLWLMHPAPQPGHAGIGAALCRGPAIRLEPALLAIRGLVFQSRSPGSFCSCWAHGWRWAEPIRCISWSAPGPSSGLADLSGFCGRHDPGGAPARASGAFSARGVRGLHPNDKTNLAPYRFLHLAILIIWARG